MFKFFDFNSECFAKHDAFWSTIYGFFEYFSYKNKSLNNLKHLNVRYVSI